MYKWHGINSNCIVKSEKYILEPWKVPGIKNTLINKKLLFVAEHIIYKSINKSKLRAYGVISCSYIIANSPMSLNISIEN